MLVIRLKRIGRKNKPYYRIVVQEKQKAPTSTVIERLGSLDPHVDPAKIILEKDRAKYWLSQGAQPSATVHNIFVNEGLISGSKMKVVQPKIDQDSKDLKDKEDKKDSATPKASQESKDDKKEAKVDKKK